MKTTLLTIIIALLSASIFISSCGNPEYESSITKADSLYEAKDYANAKIYYEKAHEILPDEEYPQTRITAISKIMQEIARKKAIEDKNKYETFISKADELFQNKKYKKAKGFYQNALNVMPKEKHPQNRIKTINEKLAEAKAMKNYPYHVVVGCFEVKKNATNYHDKIQNNYSKDSRTIPILNGRMDAITYKSFKSQREAYNALTKAREITPAAWVMRK